MNEEGRKPRLNFAEPNVIIDFTLLSWLSCFAHAAMKILILFLFLTISTAYAGPPKNAQRVTMPFSAICTPTLTEMMSALIEDYAVHVSVTFEESPINFVMMVENPNTKQAAVLHIREGRTCLVFTGLNLKRYERDNQPRG